ncbi:transposase [Candidatus Woesearchaeota archaeon]|nr:transposase [Candidatus Woesearchaeota archaeon]
MVYKLMAEYKKEGVLAYKPKKVGRPSQRINRNFEAKVVSLRKETDYGSQKLHFVLKKQGFNVAQRQIQKILDGNGLTEPCENRRGQRKYVRYQWPISNYMWHTDWSQYKDKWNLSFIDDRSRKIMASGEFSNANEENTIFLLYQAILANEGIDFWTSRRNHPQTNGKMEKWFDTFKKRKKKHPDESLQEFVKWYNEERIHHALEYNTPEEVYRENL